MSSLDIAASAGATLEGLPGPEGTCEDHARTETISSLLVKEIAKMRRFAWMLVRDNDHADDLVQDAIVRILTYAHSWQPGTNFSAWAKAVMRNLFYTDCGRRERNSAIPIDTFDDASVPAVAATQEHRRAFGELTAAIDRLPKRQRVALSLAAFEGLSSEEIGERMRISPNAVRCHLKRGRQELRHFADAQSAPRRAVRESALARAGAESD